MKYRRSVVGPMDGKELAMLFAQITAKSKITVGRGVGNKSLNGVMVETEIGGGKTETLVDIPETIAIDVPMFVGGESSRIEIDLLTQCSRNDEITVAAVSSDVEEFALSEFERMAGEVHEHLKAKVSVGLGRVSHGEWNYIQD